MSANRRTIENAARKLIEIAEEVAEAKGDKENPTEKDEEIQAALEQFASDIESALDELLSAYEE